jgi:hypothetical protein
MSNLWSTLINTPKLIKTTFISVLIATPYTKVIKAVYYGFFDIFNYYFNNPVNLITPTKSDSVFYTNYARLKLKQSYYVLFSHNNFFYIDLIIYFFKSIRYVLFDFFTTTDVRNTIRLKQTNNGFYLNYIEKNTTFFFYWKNIFLTGWIYIWKALRYWFFAFIIGVFIFYYLCVIRLIPFNKIFFEWTCLLMFSYWLLSGFVFFVKKYQFGKYTSVIQRFWRRSYILFWLLEGFLFIIFLYLTINASAEPFYMYDQIQIFKTRLFSWRFFIFKLLPLTFLIVISYIYLLSVRWTTFSKNILFLISLTGVLTYIVWIEFYQFFHILNFYGNLYWVYDIEEHVWTLEVEPRRTRIVTHYTNLLMILKFWHIVFIYGFWLFFLLRSCEIKRVRYPLLSANLQNFIILYLFAWVSMYPWFKFYYRKALDAPYYWFYLNNRNYGFRIFWNDLKLLFYSLTNNLSLSLFINRLYGFNTFSFFYWTTYNSESTFNGFKQHFIKNEIIRVLTTI